MSKIKKGETYHFATIPPTESFQVRFPESEMEIELPSGGKAKRKIRPASVTITSRPTPVDADRAALLMASPQYDKEFTQVDDPKALAKAVETLAPDDPLTALRTDAEREEAEAEALLAQAAAKSEAAKAKREAFEAQATAADRKAYPDAYTPDSEQARANADEANGGDLGGPDDGTRATGTPAAGDTVSVPTEKAGTAGAYPDAKTTTAAAHILVSLHHVDPDELKGEGGRFSKAKVVEAGNKAGVTFPSL